MSRAFWKTLRGDALSGSREEVNRENRLAIRLLAVVGAPLAAANMLVQIALSNEANLLTLLFSTGWALGYFLTLLVLERYLIPDDYPHSTGMLYVLEAPILICSILLGTFLDQDHQAITFFIFLMAMPVFVLDKPIRMMFVTTGWVAVFVTASYMAKDPSIFERDLLHALEFYFAALAVANVVVQVRIVALARTEEARRTLEHDELTGLRNRRSLELHIPEYLGKPLTISAAILDQLDLFNDVYGHDVGNELLIGSSAILVEAFGRKSVYRFGGDEALCVVEGVAEEECLAAISAARVKLRESVYAGYRLSPTCAVGYVLGEPQTAEEFRQMVQLAEIYGHQAASKGRGQTIGGEFNQRTFRAGIVDSNLDTHLKGYETNQLTGLPSMSFFISRCDDLLSTIVDFGRAPSLGFITLPQIKRFNSEFGYAQGDKLIQQTAVLLREAFPDRMLCNIASSQFGLMCYGDEIDRGMRLVSEGLRQFKDGFPVACRAGFAEYEEGESAISLLDRARVAEKCVHDDRKTVYRLYDERLDADARFREYIVTHVDEAIERGILEVYYQPIVRTSTQAICNEEALSRWNDPTLGMLPPYRFIPPLEESRQIYKLTLHVVRQVLADMAFKRRLGLPVVPVSVNVSRYDFEQCDIVKAIADLVDASGFTREMIRIEITESAFTEDQEFLKEEVARFRRNGFQVWMDDFGSEYSTLNLLQDLDFDLIKLDVRFMRSKSDSGKNLIIVSSIIGMASQMGIATLVEGVETEEHLGVLREMGCDKMQGFLFSEPRPLESVIDRVRSGNARSFERESVWS